MKTEKEECSISDVKKMNAALNAELASKYDYYIKSDILKQARKEQGFSQEKLADLAGLHRNTVDKVENNKHESKLETIVKLCLALGLDPKSVIRIDEKKKLYDESMETATAVYLPLLKTDEEVKQEEEYLKWVLENIVGNNDPDKDIPEPPPSPVRRQRPPSLK